MAADCDRNKYQQDPFCGSCLRPHGRTGKKMKPSQATDLSEFFKLARNQCCNYSDTGPSRKKHYCCLEPRRSDHQCLLFKDLGCKWFFEAVLPLDKDLQVEWERVWLLRSDPAPPSEFFRTCPCGKRFKPKSNRQRMCPDCAEENRTRLNRKNKRIQRQKKG